MAAAGNVSATPPPFPLTSITLLTGWRTLTGNQGLVICDPPVTKVRTGEGEAMFVKARPYQGGYVDFMPQVRGGTMGAGPPRTAMLNDLVYYLRTEAQHVDLLTGPVVSLGHAHAAARAVIVLDGTWTGAGVSPSLEVWDCLVIPEVTTLRGDGTLACVTFRTRGPEPQE